MFNGENEKTIRKKRLTATQLAVLAKMAAGEQLVSDRTDRHRCWLSQSQQLCRRSTVWALWQGGYIRKLEAADTPAYLSSYVITEAGLRAVRPAANG